MKRYFKRCSWGVGETTRAMQYLMGYWGPLPLPSLKGLLGEWCWLLGNAGCCALWVGTLSVCGDPGLDQASFSPQLLAKPNRSQRARELVCNTAQSSGTRTVWSNMEKGTWIQLATKWPLSVWVKAGKSKQKHLALPLPSSYTQNLQAKMSIIGKVNWNIVYLLLSQPPAGQLTWKTKLAEIKIRNQSPLKVKGNPLIYLQDHGAKFLIFVQLFSTGQDGGCLSCPWRTIQKEVRQAVLTDKLLNWRWGEKERCYQSQSPHSPWARVGLSLLHICVQIQGTGRNETSEGCSCQSHIPKA